MTIDTVKEQKCVHFKAASPQTNVANHWVDLPYSNNKFKGLPLPYLSALYVYCWHLLEDATCFDEQKTHCFSNTIAITIEAFPLLQHLYYPVVMLCFRALVSLRPSSHKAKSGWSVLAGPSRYQSMWAELSSENFRSLLTWVFAPSLHHSKLYQTAPLKDRSPLT